jgi:hypothetical protein
VLTTYPSVADFVEEAAALGRQRALTIDTICGASESMEILTYDAQKRLIRRQPTPEMTITAWDALGRPTQSTRPPVLVPTRRRSNMKRPPAS